MVVFKWTALMYMIFLQELWYKKRSRFFVLSLIATLLPGNSQYGLSLKGHGVALYLQATLVCIRDEIKKKAEINFIRFVQKTPQKNMVYHNCAAILSESVSKKLFCITHNLYQEILV